MTGAYRNDKRLEGLSSARAKHCKDETMMRHAYICCLSVGEDVFAGRHDGLHEQWQESCCQ